MAVIVGIGYAVGGLEPLRALVRALPAGRGLAVVAVGHALPGDHPDTGVALEAGASPLRVIAAEDGMSLQTDRLYVVPPDHLLSLSDGRFVMEAIASCEGLRMPIDHFLCSLAAQNGPASVGVLLSGEGPDGTLGLSEIKAAGGRTIVQDPAEAAKSEMVEAAVNAGVVDEVLPAGSIAAALLAHAELVAAQSRVEDDRSALRSILALLRSRTGHDFQSYKPSTLLRRTRRRMVLAKVGTLWEYFRHLQAHPEEVHKLRADLLIGVTDFFRQVEAWRYLEERVLPQLVADAAPERAVRAWVPGCATGKEAYTLAMLLAEAVEASGEKIRIQIFATDADEAALAVARVGLYPEAEIRSVPPVRLRRFFERQGEGYRVTKRIREMIVFAQQNITSDPPFAKLDFVSCRNLLIYLGPEAQKKAIAIFHFSLRAGGCLFLGSAESIAGHDDLFAPVSKRWRIFRRLAATPATRPALPPFAMSEPPAARAFGLGMSRGGSLALLAQQMLLERFAPAAAIADRRRRLLYNLGPIDRYLTVAPGEGSLDVVEMAREGLRTALRGAFAKAAEGSRSINVAARVRREGVSIPVDMTVAPLRAEKDAESLLLITFEDRQPAAPAAAESAACDTGSRQLEEELRLMREELQSTVDQLEASNEELKASNEEAMAGNEELQMSNEELETSKEELQSLNDELSAVNSSLQQKNEDLKAAEAKLAQLASFPERNPNPIVEADPAGHVSYQNPAARALFPDLAERGPAHPWLADLPAVRENIMRTGARQFAREVSLGGATYEQALSHDAETGCIRIYGRDVTERRRGEDLMRSRLRLLTAAQSGMTSVDDSLRMALDEIESLTGSTIGFCHFMEADQETLALQAWSTNTLHKMCTAEGKGRHYPVSLAGVWVECVRDRRPVIHNDYASLPQRKGLPPGHAPIARELVVPIFRGGRIVAIIGVGNKPTDYTAADVEIVSHLGDFSWEILERKRFEEALKESEGQFRTLADSIPNLAWWANGDGYITWYNRGWYDYTGTTPEQMEGWGWQRVHDPQVLPEVLERWKRSIATAEPFEMEFPLRGADGAFRLFLTRVLPLKDSTGLVLRWFGTNTDITEHKRAEATLLRLNKALKALSDSSQAVIRAQDEPEYLNDVCRIVVEDCGYSMVWIGFAEDDEQKSVRPLAHSGFDEGYLETLHLTWADTERGRGPTGTAIRTGKVAACRNMLTDPAFAPWREEAIKRGYASSIVFPLRADDRVFGAITIYSQEPDPFTEDEVRLLAEFTDNVAYGIEVLRIQAAQEQAEEALSASEAKYRSLFENMIDGFALHRIVLDERGNPIDYEFLEANPAFERLTGLRRSDIIGKRVTEAIPGIESDPADWIGIYGRVATTGEEIEFEQYAEPLDRWFSVSAYRPMRDHFATIFIDITERKRAEAALQRSLRRFELLAQTAGELLQAAEPQRVVESLCRRVMGYLDCHVFFNFLVDEEAGKLRLNAYAGIPEEEARRIHWLDYGVAVCGCVGRDGSRIVAEHIATNPDERTALVKSYGIRAFACHPLLGPEGKVLGTLSFGTRARDGFREDELALMKAVTDLVAVAVARMQGAERLRRTIGELARSNKDLEQFAYVSSHDLQEPLRAVSGFMTLLESRYRDKLDERAQTYILYAVDGAKRMAQLIEGLLEYARLNSGGGRLSRCSTREALDEALAALRPTLEESAAQLTVEDLPVLQADRTQLIQVFQNLLANALKFRRPDVPVSIHIGARHQGREWVFSIRDNGIGIDPEHFDRLFVIFQRLHTRQTYPGTGIGLAIVKKIAERHGGSAWVESEKGAGSTFFFSLHAEEGEAS